MSSEESSSTCDPLGVSCLEELLSPESSTCDRTTLEMKGLSPLDQPGDSRRSENAANTHTKHTKP
jgi:hypothetical protein